MPLADGVAGITGAFAVMLALYHRDANGGGGQVIDISLTESLLPLMEPTLLDWDQLGTDLRRTGNSLSHVAPRNAYVCADGQWVALSASSQSIFERLARAIDRPELIADPRLLDLDHVGSEVAQPLGDPGSRRERGDVDDAASGEDLGAHRRATANGWVFNIVSTLPTDSPIWLSSIRFRRAW